MRRNSLSPFPGCFEDVPKQSDQSQTVAAELQRTVEYADASLKSLGWESTHEHRSASKYEGTLWGIRGALEAEFLTIGLVLGYSNAASPARLLFVPSSDTTSSGFRLRYDTYDGKYWHRHDDFLTSLQLEAQLGDEWAEHSQSKLLSFALPPTGKYQALFTGQRQVDW